MAYGFHQSGLEVDFIGGSYERGAGNGSMFEAYIKSVIKCCCLDDASMARARDFEADARRRVETGAPEGLFGSTYLEAGEVCSTEVQFVVNALRMGCSGTDSINPPERGFETGWFDGDRAYPHRLEKELKSMGNCQVIYERKPPGE
ncbi:MAG: hypothetical protein PF961_02755 [Planctomycetota bacterium]|jgi:hypothetical protein|nr:hypothetical protein [Planctomycetota bacterium]